MLYLDEDIYKGVGRADAHRLPGQTVGGRIIRRGKHTLFGVPVDAKISSGMLQAYQRAEADFRRKNPEAYDRFKNEMQNMHAHKREFWKIYRSLPRKARKKTDNAAWKYWQSTKWGKTQPYEGKPQSLVVPAGIWGGKGGGHKHGDQMDWAFGAPGGQDLPKDFILALNRQDIYSSIKRDKGHSHHQNWSPRYALPGYGGRRKRRIKGQYPYRTGKLKGSEIPSDRKPGDPIAPKSRYTAQKHYISGYESPKEQRSIDIQESRDLPRRPTGSETAAKHLASYQAKMSNPPPKPRDVAVQPRPPVKVSKSLFQSEYFIEV